MMTLLVNFFMKWTLIIGVEIKMAIYLLRYFTFCISEGTMLPVVVMTNSQVREGSGTVTPMAALPAPPPLTMHKPPPLGLTCRLPPPPSPLTPPLSSGPDATSHRAFLKTQGKGTPAASLWAGVSAAANHYAFPGIGRPPPAPDGPPWL